MFVVSFSFGDALSPNDITYGDTTEFIDIFNRPISDVPTNSN